MIFWILLVAAVVAVVITFWWWFLEDGWAYAFLFSFATAALAFIVGAGLLALAALIPGEKRTDETFELRALATSSTVHGRFFLGSGTVDGKRTLNYIAKEDGYSRLGQGVASASRVYEDTERPTVTEYTFWYSNGWVVPWEVVTGYSWDFHVPAGSILEDFTLTNE